MNDEWTHILHTVGYDFTQYKDRTLTSTQIKDAKRTFRGTQKSQFEPRLLCKQDTREKRPDILQKHGIYCLSIRNGTYLLTHTDIYHTLDFQEKPEPTRISKNTDSIVLAMGNSETSMLDNLRYSGVFESPEYLGEPIRYGPLLSGRHRCSFRMLVGDTNSKKKKRLEINGCQFETDSCYESDHRILVIEAKSGTNQSFNLRQLYFPYRNIYDHNQTSKSTKEILPIYVQIDPHQTIHIWKYTFDNPIEMTSIRCVSYRTYRFG
jgi:hypothetical protein